MKTRETVVAELADAIVSGCFHHPRICLASILDDHEDQKVLDNTDIANLITGDSETRLDILSRAEASAKDLVWWWLLHNVKGRTLVEDRLELERAEELEESL
jgi:hypothetical protein